MPSSSSDLKYMLSRLSHEELEVAARTNYEYIQHPSAEMRRRCAMEMAERYLGSKRNKEKALTKMKATIQFRQEMDIDKLRTAASDPTSDDYVSLQKFLSNKKLYVSGFDTEGRSTYIFVPRLVEDHNLEQTLMGHIWSLERAIACSKAKDKTVNAVVDFDGFSSFRNAPPTDVGKAIMTTLRDHYVGHINSIFVLNAPTAFFCLWALFKPFAGKNTRRKIHFINSNSQKEQVLGKVYSKDQAPSWMLPNGKKNRKLDIDEYLHETAFYRAFDEL